MALIAQGTVVCVVPLDSETAYTVTVESVTSSVVSNQGQAAEFVFVGGKWRSRVLNVAFAAQT